MNKNLPTIAAAANASQQKTGCPGLLQIAQCVLETGWLKYAPQNNCFGIKAYAGCHGRQLLTTREWFTPDQLRRFLSLGEGREAHLATDHTTTLSGDRREYVVKDFFATFETLGDCFAKRAAMWDKGPYAHAAAKFREDGDLTALVDAIAPIYATDPKYASSVHSIISMADVQSAWRAVQHAA